MEMKSIFELRALLLVKKEYEKTSKFIAKINNGNVGVDLYELNEDQFVLTVGGYKIPGDGDKVGSSSFLSEIEYSVNYSLEAFEKNNGVRTVYFKTYLDKNMSHIKGEIPQHPFEKIKEHEWKLNGSLRTNKNKYFFGKRTDVFYSSVFEKKNKFYYGYVDAREGQYKILEFD